MDRPPPSLHPKYSRVWNNNISQLYSRVASFAHHWFHSQHYVFILKCQLNVRITEYSCHPSPFLVSKALTAALALHIDGMSFTFGPETPSLVSVRQNWLLSSICSPGLTVFPFKNIRVHSPSNGDASLSSMGLRPSRSSLGMRAYLPYGICNVLVPVNWRRAVCFLLAPLISAAGAYEHWFVCCIEVDDLQWRLLIWTVKLWGNLHICFARFRSCVLIISKGVAKIRQIEFLNVPSSTFGMESKQWMI